MNQLKDLEQLDVPLGGQQVALQEIVHAAGAMPMLRLRIREGKRFTVLDFDPVTAGKLASALQRWADAQTDIPT